MRLRYFLSIWALSQPLLALVIPHHDAQSPIQLEQQRTRNSAFDYVILAFTEENDSKIYHAEVPLGVRIPSGLSLPMRPRTLKIETAVNSFGRANSLADFEDIACRVVPMLSSEDKAAWDILGVQEIWPWFKARDDTVSLELSSSQWFIAGREVASYECW